MDTLDRRIERLRRNAVHAALDLLARELRETGRPDHLARAGRHLAGTLRDWVADLDRVRRPDTVAATFAALDHGADAEPDYWTLEGGWHIDADDPSHAWPAA